MKYVCTIVLFDLSMDTPISVYFRCAFRIFIFDNRQTQFFVCYSRFGWFSSFIHSFIQQRERECAQIECIEITKNKNQACPTIFLCVFVCTQTKLNKTNFYRKKKMKNFTIDFGWMMMIMFSK